MAADSGVVVEDNCRPNITELKWLVLDASISGKCGEIIENHNPAITSQSYAIHLIQSIQK